VAPIPAEVSTAERVLLDEPQIEFLKSFPVQLLKAFLTLLLKGTRGEHLELNIYLGVMNDDSHNGCLSSSSAAILQ